MGTSTSSAGRWAIVAAAAIAVVMLLYRFLFNGSTTIAVGMSIVGFAVALFIALFYSNLNTVQRTGAMSFIIAVAIALLLPYFLITTNQQNQNNLQAQYDSQLQYAAGVFATYCSQCHGLLGQGINGPQLNNNSTMNNLTQADITRIISGGVPDPANLQQYSMPAWSQNYGGPMNTNDINALVAFVMSSNPTLRAKVNAPTAVNGFDYVLGTLTDPTQIALYQQQKQATQSHAGPAIDLTSLSAVTIPIIDTPNSATTQYDFIYTDSTNKQWSTVKVKVGTKITWVNKSSAAHSIYSGSPGNNSNVFSDPLIIVNGTFSWTPTAAGTYAYYCSFHPSMIAYIIVTG